MGLKAGGRVCKRQKKQTCTAALWARGRFSACMVAIVATSLYPHCCPYCCGFSRVCATAILLCSDSVWVMVSCMTRLTCLWNQPTQTRHSHAQAPAQPKQGWLRNPMGERIIPSNVTRILSDAKPHRTRASALRTLQAIPLPLRPTVRAICVAVGSRQLLHVMATEESLPSIQEEFRVAVRRRCSRLPLRVTSIFLTDQGMPPPSHSRVRCRFRPHSHPHHQSCSNWTVSRGDWPVLFSPRLCNQRVRRARRSLCCLFCSLDIDGGTF